MKSFHRKSLKNGLYKSFVGLSIMVMSVAANAQLSQWGENIAGEGGKFLLLGQFLFGIIGFFTFVFGGLEYKKQKSGQKDYGLAYTLFAIGIFLGIAAPMYIQSIKSVTNEDVEIRSEFDDF